VSTRIGTTAPPSWRYSTVAFYPRILSEQRKRAVIAGPLIAAYNISSAGRRKKILFEDGYTSYVGEPLPDVESRTIDHNSVYRCQCYILSCGQSVSAKVNLFLVPRTLVAQDVEVLQVRQIVESVAECDFAFISSDNGNVRGGSSGVSSAASLNLISGVSGQLPGAASGLSSS
jgi:hypothetical protein